MFRDKTVVLLCVLTGAVQFALISIMILGAINIQSVLGYSAVISGLTALPLSIVLATLAPFTGRLSGRLGSKPILVTGFSTYATGMIVLILVLTTRATPLATFLASDMRARASAAADSLPAPARPSFLNGFATLGQTGLSVGRGQSGGATVPASVPEPLRTQLQHLIGGDEASNRRASRTGGPVL